MCSHITWEAAPPPTTTQMCYFETIFRRLVQSSIVQSIQVCELIILQCNPPVSFIPVCLHLKNLVQAHSLGLQTLFVGISGQLISSRSVAECCHSKTKEYLPLCSMLCNFCIKRVMLTRATIYIFCHRAHNLPVIHVLVNELLYCLMQRGQHNLA